MNEFWLVLRVRPTKENIFATIMERQDVEIEVPLKHVWRRKTRYCPRKELIGVPLLPGYVLMKVEPSKGIPWLKINLTKHVIGILGQQNTPKALSSKDAARLLARTAAPKNQRRMKSNLEFKVGDTVVVTTGMFEGMELPVTEITNRHAIFYPKMFGRRTRTDIKLDDVEKIG